MALVAVAASLVATVAEGQVREGFATAPDGIRIHYLDAGSGRAILFVPGWTMPAEIWEPQLRHFRRDFRAIAMDPRSQGTSTQTSEGLDSATRARDIRAVITHLRLTSVVLVAWSQGVTEAAAYVAEFGTADLAGLVFVDGVAGGEFDAPTVGRIVKSLAGFQSNRESATRAFVRSMYKTPQPDAYLESMTRGSLRTSTAAALAMSVGALTADHQAVLPRIDKPCLIIAPSGSMIGIYESMRDKIPGAQLVVIEHAGHAVFVDAAGEFNRIVDEFIRRRVLAAPAQ